MRFLLRVVAFVLTPWLAASAQGVDHGLQPTTDPVSQGIAAATLVVVFVLLSLDAAHRVLVTMTAVAGLLVVTYATPYHLITFEGMRDALDLNVLVLLASMMAVVGVLKTTGVFEWAVSRVVRRAGGRPLVLLALVIWFTAITSAFLDNVTAVVFATPMVLAVARHAGVSPATLLLPMVMASNIGGTATLIGDPPNIMIGSGAGLSFVDFMEALTLPCAVMILWLEFFTRRYWRSAYGAAGEPASEAAPEARLTDPVLARWLAGICAGILVGFLTHHVTGTPAAVPALVGAAAALVVQDVLYVRRERPSMHERAHGILQVTEREIEWPTLAFFGSLFVVVGAASNTGLIATMAGGLQWTVETGGRVLGLSPNGTLLFAALLICWVSGLMSALIDNIPFVAVAIPVIAGIIPGLQGETGVLWWALALGACLGGNGTPIGASANVTTVGLAEKGGARIRFGEFTRYAAPVTIGTLVIASAYLALHIYLGKHGSFAVMAATFAVLGAMRYVSGRVPRPALSPSA